MELILWVTISDFNKDGILNNEDYKILQEKGEKIEYVDANMNDKFDEKDLEFLKSLIEFFNH